MSKISRETRHEIVRRPEIDAARDRHGALCLDAFRAPQRDNWALELEYDVTYVHLDEHEEAFSLL